MPDWGTLTGILVAAAMFAYGITWACRPMVKWMLRGKDDGAAHTWIVRLVSVCAGILVGIGVAEALEVKFVWGISFGAGGGAMAAFIVGLVKKRASKALGGDPPKGG